MATRSWNRVELIGNLTRDPELRYTPSGAAVATFSIATNRTYMVEGERKEEADFHRCVAWNKLAELCSQLLKKGTRVFVSGRLQNRSWEGQDGTQKQTTEIVIEDMIILTNKGASEEYSEDVTPVRGSRSHEEPKGQKSQSEKTVAPDDSKEAESKDGSSDSKEAPVAEEELPGGEEPNLDDLPF